MSVSDGRSSSGLLARAEQIAREFDFGSQDARKVTAHFVEHMKSALQQQDSLSQIPSYVRAIPTGREKGVFLAVDLGGTNCRVCSVQLHGDCTYTLVQTKYPIPRSLTVNQSYKPLFRFIAEKIRDFLEEHPEADVHGDKDPSAAAGPSCLRREDFRKLGFTFSFTYEQHSLAKGSVMFWDKGWDIPEALGRDPCEMLQEGLDELNVPVLVVALANDSVGTLLTRAYTSPQGKTSAMTTIGAIFGTGTNAAYVERLENVKRLHGRADFQTREPEDLMVINTEWGCFGDGQEGVLPSTIYDKLLDASSPHPQQEMTEKRISGLYLGELLRLVVLRMVDEKLFSMTLDPSESPVFRKEGIESSLLSHIAGEEDDKAVAHITRTFKADNVSVEDARAIQMVAKAIARRAARLAGVSLAAIIVQCDQSRDSGSIVSSSLLSKKSDGLRIEDNPVHAKKAFSSSSSSSVGGGGGLGAMYRRFRAFIYGLVRSLGLGWLLRPAMAAANKQKPVPAAPVVAISVSEHQQQPRSTRAPTDEEQEEQEHDVVEVGVDGSLIEFYPTFEQEIREAVGDVLGPEYEKRLRIGMAKDGSGVGAALVALAATMQKEH